MAVVLQASNLVWEKVKQATSNANPEVKATFKALRDWLVTQKGNPDLQFITYSAEQAATDHGVDLVGAACTLYGWYAKARRTTATTVAFQALHSAATNDATTTTVVTSRINLTGQQFSWVTGRGVAIATGLTIASADAVGGSTETTAALATDGFVIIGAA